MAATDSQEALAVRVRCRSWEHFVELFEGELLAGQVFLPAKQTLPVGTPLELTFELPDKSEIVLAARVQRCAVAGAQDEPRTGVWLSHAGLSAQDAALVRARLKALKAQSAPRAEPNAPAQEEPEIVVGVLPAHKRKRHKEPELPLHEQLRKLHDTAFALSQMDDLGVLGLDPTASAEKIRAHYLELSKRYHPHRQARLGSAEAQRVATDIYVRVQAAYGRLTGSQRVPQPEGGARPRTQRSRSALQVSEAVSLLDFHQYDVALERLHAVLKQDPEHHGAQLWVGITLARKRKAAGDFAGAAEAYRRVLELDSEHVEAREGLQRAQAAEERPRAGLLSRLFGKGD